MADGEEEEEEEIRERWTPRIDRDWEAIEFAPESYQEDRDFMLKLCSRKGAGYAYQFACEDILENTEDFEFVLAAVQNSEGVALKWAPKEMHRNRDFMLGCVATSADVLELVSNKVKNDEGAKSKSVKGVFYCNRRGGNDGLPFKTGVCNPVGGAQCESCSRILDDPDNCPLPQDRAFFMKALKKNWQALKYADKELCGEKEIVMQAVQTGGWAIQYASDELKADRDVALAAVKQNWSVFRSLNKRLRADREIAQAALQQDWHGFKLAAKELRSDMGLATEVVEQSWQGFQFLIPELRRDRDLAFKAVTQNWQAFEHVGKDLKADIELALIAVRQNGEALALVADALKEDRHVVEVAVRQNWKAIQHAGQTLRADKALIMELVQTNGFALKHAVEDLKSDQELVEAAMGQQWPATTVAVHPLFHEEDGLDPAFWNSFSEQSGLSGTKLKPAVPLLPLKPVN